ncbi:MAG: two-component sensor histidine kinase [Rhodoluna sp.]|nr:two-component sensor histidine kinase [Rhodoluna sp.]
MNSFLTILLAVTAGLIVGAGFVLVLTRDKRKKQLEAIEAERAIPEGAVEILDLLTSAGVILNGSNTVVRATNGALALGLVQNRLLIHSELVRLVELVRGTGRNHEIEAELSTGLRGESIWVLARAARMENNNVMLLVEDRTEAKRLEETRRDFVANISHELKTPIGAIGLLAEALQDATDDPAMVTKFAGNLYKESRRLGSLVQEIIQLSRLQSAELSKTGELVDLEGIVHESVERNQVIAEAKNITLDVVAPSGVVVYGDHEMLTMAVKNLIENAILYSDSDSTVGIGLRSVNGIAEIAVTDHGVGIAAEDQERIFERFYRVDPSRSRDTGGTGLGLSIVKHVASNHRGEIKLFSQVGIGSTFTLRLPLADTNLNNENKDGNND